MKSIGLCMIVKNESHVIVRCLESVRPLVDYVLIEDTGSTDGTQEIVRTWLREHCVAGQVIDEPWRDFAYNRTHVMEALRNVRHVDYALIIDADDTLVLDADCDVGKLKSDLNDDLYDVQIRHGSSRFLRPQICNNQLPFCFKAVLHEYLEAPPGVTRSRAPGFHIQTGRGGARSQNPRKYEDDAAALEKALLSETDAFLISRYTFYLAQSYRDCGEKEKSLTTYLRRAEQGFWAEEIYYSLYQAAKLKEELGGDADEIIALYEKAAAASPGRAEALHGAARFCRLRGRNEEGFNYAKRAAEKTLPDDSLFAESWIYDYGSLDEIGINGYWSGQYRASLDACLSLLGSSTLPTDQRDRVSKNAKFSLEKLRGDPNPALFHPEGVEPGGHAPRAPRRLHSRSAVPPPKILLAILAKQKEATLPFYLRCIDALDYPKDRITVYIRTNNNTDGTQRLLAEWIDRVRGHYAAIEYDSSDVVDRVQDFGVHEWNPTRFSVLGAIRQRSLDKVREHGCDFYFTADVDNFLRPCTLRELVALDLPIVAPMLRHSDAHSLYSNTHVDIDQAGYYRSCDEYDLILKQAIVGLFEVPVVHCTYLIRADIIPHLHYNDDTSRHEYVVFSESARQANIPQYFDNRQIFGYLTLTEEPEAAMGLLEAEIARAETAATMVRPVTRLKSA